MHTTPSILNSTRLVATQPQTSTRPEDDLGADKAQQREKSQKEATMTTALSHMSLVQMIRVARGVLLRTSVLSFFVVFGHRAFD